MKIFSLLVFVSLLCSSVQAAGDCENAVAADATVFRSFDLGTEFACLYESPGVIEYAVLSFYSRTSAGSKLISSNKKLSILDDGRNGVNLPDVTKTGEQTYQILWDYPNGVDVIELIKAGDSLYFKEAVKEMRLPLSSDTYQGASLTLINSDNRSERLSFSELATLDIFDKDYLRLKDGEISGIITSQKAFLYGEPLETSRTKGYLIKGDVVRILAYRSGFLKIMYKMTDGRSLIRWVDVASVI